MQTNAFEVQTFKVIATCDFDHVLPLSDPAILSFAMGRDFHLFVLQERSPQSHTWMRQFRHKIDVSAETNVESLVEVVRNNIKSHLDKSWVVDVDDMVFGVYRVRRQ